MAKEPIRIRVWLDEDTFTRFAAFNNLKLHKRMRQPLLFMVIMLAFALVCFVSGKPQGGLTGLALLLAGVALPAYYTLRFRASVRAGVKAHGLPREVYELHLTGTGVDVQSLAKGGEAASLKWKDMHHAYRVDGCIYLYALPQRAFLLPDGQAQDAGADEVWQWIASHMNPAKVSDIRKKHAPK